MTHEPTPKHTKNIANKHRSIYRVAHHALATHQRTWQTQPEYPPMAYARPEGISNSSHHPRPQRRCATACLDQQNSNTPNDPWQTRVLPHLVPGYVRRVVYIVQDLVHDKCMFAAGQFGAAERLPEHAVRERRVAHGIRARRSGECHSSHASEVR